MKEMDNGRIRKVNLQSLTALLQELYSRGVDYIDLYGEDGGEEENDTIHIVFSKSYMNSEFAENFDEFDEEDEVPPNVKVKLSDEDLNNLI